MPRNHPVLPAEWRQAISQSNKRHGHAGNRNGKPSPTYIVWMSMKQRCLNPGSTNYGKYGANGVTVCDRWLIFDNFLADMGERPAGMTLDRIDNGRGYEPGNCRWASPRTQRRNQRRSVLSESDITWIRANAGQIPQRTMAAQLGVSHGLIGHIVSGLIYKSDE